MTRVLIAYSTVDGQTLRIAEHIAQRLRGDGHTVTLAEIGSGAPPQLSPYDKIVVGASIRYGHHRKEVYRLVEASLPLLQFTAAALWQRRDRERRLLGRGAYEAMGVPVWPDVLPDYPGPLAGLLTGLERCETPYLVTVPCDTPHFPADLVARLAATLETEDAEIAMAAAPEGGALRTQPVFCLLKHELLESLVNYLHSGQRKIDRWTAQHRCVVVEFDDPAAFFNANTLAELQHLQSIAPR